MVIQLSFIVIHSNSIVKLLYCFIVRCLIVHCLLLYCFIAHCLLSYIVIHSHTIVSICNAVRKQLCDHCINYCVTIVCRFFFNLVFSISSTSTSTSNIINPFNLVFSIYSYQSIQSCFFNLINLFQSYSILLPQPQP